MEKRIYPCFVAGKQESYTDAVVVGYTRYISKMNGRSSETGEAMSDTMEGQESLPKQEFLPMVKLRQADLEF